MVKWKHFLISFWLFFCTVVYSFYNDFCCPSTLEWVIRGRWYCMNYTNLNGEYSCLYNDITKVFDESCRFEAHRLDRGEEYVLKHNPTGVECKDISRYQPFGLHRFQSGCVFQRTQCSESGQVVYHKGSSKVDATCRCNFKEGYAFIKPPKADCSCTPSEEDCSCYFKVCPPDFELKADYKCVHKNDKSYFPSCPDMLQTGVDNKYKHNTQVISKDHEIKDMDLLYKYIGTSILLVIIIMLLVVACILATKESLLSSCCIDIKSPHNLTAVQEGKTLKISWSSGENEHSSNIQYIVYVTYSDIWEDDKTRSIMVDAGKLHCYLHDLISDILPKETYRFKVYACKNNKKSEPSAEEIFETGLPKEPQDVKTLHKEGNILLQWAPPKISVFKIDRYKIQYTTNDTWTNTPVYETAEVLEYVVKDAIAHITYRFKICSCSHGIEGEELERLYSTDHPFEGKMNFKTSEQNGYERVIDELIRKKLDERLESFQGKRFMLTTDVKFSSVIVFFTFISHGYNDETEMRKKFVQAFKEVVIGHLTISLCDFTFKSLNNPEPPHSLRVENAGHNKVAVKWNEPTKTFFKTERFIIQYTTDNWATDKTEYVSSIDTSYFILKVLPAIYIEFRIYTEICHSIRSLASKVVGTTVEGPSPPQNVKASNIGTYIELSWTAPLHPIMDFVKHFVIKIQEMNTASCAIVDKDELSFSLPNCKPSAIYRFEVLTYTTNKLFSKASPLLQIKTEDTELLNRIYGHAQVHLKKGQFKLNNKLTLTNRKKIKDITQLPNGLLVMVVCNLHLLITCDIHGEGVKTVPLNNFPCNIAAVDNDTVVVSQLGLPLYPVKCVVVSVIDIKNGHIRNIGTYKSRDTDSFPILYANNKLFIHSNYGEISVIDLLGNTQKKLALKDDMTILSSMCYDFNTDYIYGTTLVSPDLIRINRQGTCKSVFDFTNYDVAIPRNVCVDNKSGVLVTCQRKTQRHSKYHVYRIIPDSEFIREVISLPFSWELLSPCILYHLPSNSIIIACGPTISVYKTTDGK